MSWVDKRIDEYSHGSPSTWLERRMLEHAHPVHFTLAWIAMIGLVYGLWQHDWLWIAGSMIIGVVGHVYCWMEPDQRDEESTRRSDRTAVNAR
jgi:uncharacterized membrane protein